MMGDLGVPFGGDVLKRTGGDNRETYQEYICLWVTQRPQTILNSMELGIRFERQNRYLGVLTLLT